MPAEPEDRPARERSADSEVTLRPSDNPPSGPPEGPGAGPVPRLGIALAAAFFIVLGGVDVVTLIGVWPALVALTSPINVDPLATLPISVIAWSVNVNRDQALFVAVVLAGALGGLVHALRSFAWYVGHRQLRYSWLLFYLTVPLVGASLGFLFSLILRAGLISGNQSNDLNVWGFAAIAALVGLFSSQAAEKLRDVFSILFSPAERGSDSTPKSGEHS